MGEVLRKMKEALADYLPEETAGLPKPTVSIITVNNVPVGIGSSVGMERRAGLVEQELHAGRLDALVRYQLWGADADLANDAVLDLHSRLLAAGQDLWSAGFLRFAAETSSNAAQASGGSAWGRTADFRLLYEYAISLADQAQSLITRIPVAVDREVRNSPERETTTVTGPMTRWDEQTAPALVIRGRATIGRLAALAFVPGAQPGGPVTLTRTFDGAVNPPAALPSLDAFLAAVASPAAAERNARVTFTSLADLLAALDGPGAVPFQLGDWNEDAVLDAYQSYTRSFDPPISMTAAEDRLELAYGSGSQPLDQVGVIYLKLERG